MEKNKAFYNPENTPNRIIDLNDQAFLGKKVPETDKFNEIPDTYLQDIFPSDDSIPLGDGGYMKKKLPGQP